MVNTDLRTSFGNYFKMRLWGLIGALLIMPCLYTFSYRKQMTADADFLAGRPEIERFYSVNCKCLWVAIIVLVIEIVLFGLLCVRSETYRLRIITFVVAICIASVTVVAFTISVSHIRSDLKATTVTELDRYVLSTNKEKYYLGFDDAGALTQIPVKKETFDALSEGDKLEKGMHSIVYDSIVDAGYGSPVEYSDKIKIEYYYYSAMLEKAELK